MTQELVATQVFLDYHRVEALLATFGGNVGAVAKSLGCRRNIVETFIQSYPTLILLREDIRETIVDYAEDNLNKAVLEGDLTVSAMIVKTLGRERGYATRVENKNENYDSGVVKDTLVQARRAAQEASRSAQREHANG